ncbi:hypothetical protein [Streptomyces sp. 8L]|uniref:hypothetical protein n=1 Tax=Streptomyces sp. 8L TaxID=2877242 RepID=UPI001CD65276|nr:hypothetical protein [Streptomyces sp. 8L]MCA1220089.1 hypothetical protein [Streptomyces sp. 8L]
MDVTFRKLPGRRYEMTVVRAHGPVLAPRGGPGYDDHLPHDAVHFLVEAEAGLTGGAFGRIAAGHSNIFWPEDPARRRRQARRESRRSLTPAQHADMARSERLAALCQGQWRVRHGRLVELPVWLADVTEDRALLRRIAARLDVFADDWHALPAGGGLTLTWPHPVARPSAPGGAAGRTRRTGTGARTRR